MEQNEKEVKNKKVGRPKKTVTEKKLSKEISLEKKELPKKTIKPINKKPKENIILEKEELENNQTLNDKSVSFNLIEVIVIILMTSIVVGVSTGIIVYKNHNKIESSNKNSNTTYIKELESVYNKLLNSYVEQVDEKDLVNAAIKGMYSVVGDPYTSYLDKDTTEDLNDRLNGEYQGIGVEITKIEEGILIVTVFENGPAHSAGLLEGDVITKINNEDVTNSTAAEVSNKIKNSKNEKISVSYLRGGITKTTEIDIRQVYVPSVEKENYDGVGYLKITTFSNTTYKQFKESLEELENEGINSLIIDVRNNGGGYLNSAVDIAKLFIEKGKTIYGLESKKGTEYYKDDTKESRNYRVGILINGNSASASEILASALKESYDATLIGTKSYGKGTVQETSELSSGGMIKVTTAYWLTPEGNKINGVGLKPDVEISASYKENMPLEEDTQLKEAINTVK